MSALAVLGSALATPVGFDTAATFCAFQAALSNFKECEFAISNPRVEPIVASAVPSLASPRDDGFEPRLLRLAGHALGEVAAKTGLDSAQTPLFLALPEPARFARSRRSERAPLLPRLAELLGVRLHPYSEEVAEGKAGFVVALQRARDSLARGHVGACFVGGVDSFLNNWDLRRLNAAFRIKREGVPRGFIPGEAAGVLAVTAGAARGTEIVGEILGIGVARESDEATLAGAGVATGRALQRALEGALRDARADERDVTARFSDVNGEAFAGMESLLAGGRVFRSYRPAFPVSYAAASVGECGAAIGPILVALAIEQLRRRTERGAAACETSSDSGLRGACIVRAA